MTERIRLSDDQIQAVRDVGPGWCGDSVFEAICTELLERRTAEREQTASEQEAWKHDLPQIRFAAGMIMEAHETYRFGYAAGKGALLRATAAAAFQEGKREAEARERELREAINAVLRADNPPGLISGLAALEALVRDS